MNLIIFYFVCTLLFTISNSQSIEVCKTETSTAITTHEFFLHLFPNEQNMLLFLYKNKCSNDIEHIYFNHAQIEFGPSSISLYTFNYESIETNIHTLWNINYNCSSIVFIPRNTNYNNIPQKRKICSNQNLKPFHKWLTSLISSQHIKIINKHNNKVKQILCNYDEIVRNILPANMQTPKTITAWIGDVILWRDAITNNLLSWHIIKGYYGNQIIEITDNKTLCDLKTDINCNQMKEEYAIQWRMNEWNGIRIAKNIMQPTLIPHFTDIGYVKHKLSDTLYKQLKAFWDINKNKNAVIEPIGGPTFNQYESKNMIVYLSEKLEKLIWNEVEELIRMWIKNDDIKLIVTSIYGIRKYKNGAIVKDHIDICNTHVFGAVLQIDQKVDKPWPFRILAHDNKYHNIVLEPQDIVLYEAASGIHARPEPLQGDYYANAFIHFKPNGWKCPY